MKLGITGPSFQCLVSCFFHICTLPLCSHLYISTITTKIELLNVSSITTANPRGGGGKSVLTTFAFPVYVVGVFFSREGRTNYYYYYYYLIIIVEDQSMCSLLHL